MLNLKEVPDTSFGYTKAAVALLQEAEADPDHINQCRGLGMANIYAQLAIANAIREQQSRWAEWLDSARKDRLL